MRFFYQEKLPSAGPKINPLFTAVSTYMKSIDMGDYNPKLPDTNWSSADESICIRQLLKNASKHFEEIDIPEDLAVPKDPAVREELGSCVPQVAHLLASLTILDEYFQVVPHEQLKKIKEMGILTQVKAGMPGPCMVYIDALLNPESGRDNISKITLLSEVIIDLNAKGDKFSDLNSVVLSVAIDQWLSLINTLEPAKKDLFTDEERAYQAFKRDAFPVVRDGVSTTFIDQCVLKVWEKLDINVGLELRDKSSPSNNYPER